MRKLKLSSLKGLDKFQAALMNDGLPAMVGWLKSKKKADLLMMEVHKHIFELGPPTPPEKRTGRSNYYQLLTYHLAEIQTTLDTMRDIEFYMGRFPYSGEGRQAPPPHIPRPGVPQRALHPATKAVGLPQVHRAPAQEGHEAG